MDKSGLQAIDCTENAIIPMEQMLSDFTRERATRYLVNAEFNEAAVYFTDGSFLQFCHKGLHTRWARPSTDDTIAGEVSRALRLFRLNAKHLQLFFNDGSDTEFFARPESR